MTLTYMKHTNVLTVGRGTKGRMILVIEVCNWKSAKTLLLQTRVTMNIAYPGM